MSSGPAALLTPCRRSLRRAGRSLANPIPGTARVPCPSPFTLGGLRSPRVPAFAGMTRSPVRTRWSTGEPVATGGDTPPAHPVSAATRSQGLAPLPATERGDYGAGPECGGLMTLTFWESTGNQRVGSMGSADNRRIVSGPCLLPVRVANGDGGGVPDRAPCFYPSTPAPRGAAVPLPIASGDREETGGSSPLPLGEGVS